MAAAGEADRKNSIQVSRTLARHSALPFALVSSASLPLPHREYVGSTHISTFDQVAASRPVAFYASLAKKLLLDNATVELSAIGASLVALSI